MRGQGGYPGGMTSFAEAIRPRVEREHDLARAARDAGRPDEAFAHLENAHVLGQSVTREHCRAHWAMLLWGVRNRDLVEVFGQVFRLVGALSKTWLGLVPAGNTGGSRVSPFRPLPVRAELQEAIDEARRESRSVR